MFEWILLIAMIIFFILLNNAIVDLKQKLQEDVYALSKDIERINKQVSYLNESQERFFTR